MGSSGNPLQQQNDTVRIPPYSTETDRSYDLDYVGQALVNCFAHVVRNPVTGDGEVQVSKRPGVTPTSLDLTTHFTSYDPSMYDNIYAVYAVTNLYDVYVVAMKDNTTPVTIRIIQVRPEAGTSTLIGSITTSGDLAHKVYFSHGWTDTQASPSWTLTVNFVDGGGVTNKAYTAEASAGVFTAASLAEITGLTSPWGAGVKTRGPILQLNNQWYVAALDGRIYSTGNTLPQSSYVSQADINTTGPNYQSWSDAARFIASRFPEQFEGMILYKHHLVAFGKTSIQFYNDEGQSLASSGIPILPTDQALIRFGAMSCNHMINVDDVLYWISYGKNDTVGVWRLDGYTPVKISNKATDDVISSLFTSGFANFCYLYTFMMGNKKHVGIGGTGKTRMSYSLSQTGWPATLTSAYNTSYGASCSFVYNVDDKTWWELSLNNLNIIGISPFTLFNRTNTSAYRQYFMRADSLRVWYVANVFYDIDPSDNTTRRHVMATVQFNTLDFENENRKRFNKIKAIFRGAPNIAAADTSYLVLAYNRNNRSVATNFNNRYIDYYNTSYRYYWNNLGMARQINFALVDISDQPMELRYLELDLTQGID
jgi:hypothetical protein